MLDGQRVNGEGNVDYAIANINCSGRWQCLTNNSDLVIRQVGQMPQIDR